MDLESAPRHRLVSPDRLRMLMERTGSGSSISGRELASAIGVAHGTVNGLLSGTTSTQPAATAYAICQVIGVDLLILWAPTGRAVPAVEDDIRPSAARSRTPAPINR